LIFKILFITITFNYFSQVKTYFTDLYKDNILKIYGISQNPDTKDYIIVLENSYCKECGEIYTNVGNKWCEPCQINNLKKHFSNCTSGNEKIDEFIQEMQLKVKSYYDTVVEWIPYNQFNNFKEIGKGGFATVYLAIWKDGPLGFYENEYKRLPNKKVALKYLHNSQNITSEFLNEVCNLFSLNLIKYF
jgi:hypothetical protein